MGEVITDKKEIEEILLNSPYLRLGVCRDKDPYIVPMAFGYKDRAIYLHSSKKGKKIEILKVNPNVCFEADAYYGLVPSDRPYSYDMKYESVTGSGTATILEDEEEIREGLAVIAGRYHSGNYDPRSLNTGGLAVIRIAVKEMTGRKNLID
ncbi:pyridoxamine 5'-phosphate oxidase family protein [Methanolacinia petrolearia]|uniref:pyridoxamine 5'-phosphate oxidase family protein n=1 Tax=Methanolacinia petrolearia TaxID=54120 RepID=UPI003BABC724